jgi:hypothetical protein
MLLRFASSSVVVAFSLLTACSVHVDHQAAEPRACTEEARVCADGTSRGRSGPDCAFDPCPEDAATAGTPPTDDAIADPPAPIAPPPEGPICTKEAKQCPDGSYVGRTGPQCEFAPCPGQ